MTTQFLSDLHLDPQRPPSTALFEADICDDDDGEIPTRVAAARCCG